MASLQPDLRLLERLAVFHYVSLACVALAAGTVLLGWLLPAWGAWLPQGWQLMKANTSLCMLLAAAALELSLPRHGARQQMFSRLAALLILALAGSALLGHLTGLDLGLDQILARDAMPHLPGRMSLQASAYLTIFALVLLGVRSGRAIAPLVDALVVALLALTLVVLAGYCFGAGQLFGQSAYTRTSPVTLGCMALLWAVVFGRRAEYGLFAVMVGVGISSRLMRPALPVLLVLPFATVIATSYLGSIGWLSPPYVLALSATTLALLLFVLALVLARRLDRLERGLHDMSITDELTRTYNRRGLLLLGEQAMREARRSRSTLTVLFFDLDGLKQVNDNYGHEAGSLFLLDMGELLMSNFGGADIVARVGGDEFAVVTHSDEEGARRVRSRVDAAAHAMNRAGGRQYQVCYSVGQASLDPAGDETFGALINRADTMMYEQKRAKHERRHVG